MLEGHVSGAKNVECSGPEALVEHHVERCGLERGEKESQGGSIKRLDRARSADAPRESAEHAPFRMRGVRQLRERFAVPAGEKQILCFGVRGRCRSLGSEQQTYSLVEVRTDQRASDEVIVQGPAESLRPEPVRHAEPGESVEACLGGLNSPDARAPDADTEAIPGEVSETDLVDVPIGPLHLQAVVHELREFLGGLSVRVHREELPRDRDTVLHSRETDRIRRDTEVGSEDSRRFERRKVAFLNVQVDVLAAARGLIRRGFIDQKILGALLDDAADSRNIRRDVDRGRDVRIAIRQSCGSGRRRIAHSWSSSPESSSRDSSSGSLLAASRTCSST